MLTPEEYAVIKERVVPELDRMRSIQRRRAFSGARGQMIPDPAFTALGGLDDAAEAIAALLDDVAALRAELADVLAERDAMQALATQSGRELAEAVRVLSELEWVRRDWGGSWGFECPDCCANEYNTKGKHEDGCELSAFLARHREARP